jgi:ethanolamine phosphate phosphodiesterase
MRLQHVAQQQFRRLSHRYVFLRHLSWTTTLLSLVWFYTVYWGERSVYSSSIEACEWSSWEQWPQEAKPHRLVLVADPQLVDPHTYPGRPWPLSTLTERYTDLYMSRNFRLINADLDPDSIFFLGDLFDGGREWPPEKAKRLKTSQREQLERLGVLAPKEKKESILGNVKSAFSKSKADESASTIGKDGQDLKAFIPGEDGKWVKWGATQWYKDLDRFARIFYDPKQLYPSTRRTIFAAYDVEADPISVANGANEGRWQEYATSGGKSRKVVSSLPGNHDVGFGAGVQLSVRDRFESHFGVGNRVDVIGNHTIISIDSPSLSAHSQYVKTGWESEAAQYEELTHLWKPAWDFIENINASATRAISEAMREYYPREGKDRGWSHEVIDPQDPTQLAANKPISDARTVKTPLPVILLTHVPLYRPPDSECGPMREKGRSIKVQYGYQYQNVVTQTLSKDIVSKVSTAGDIVIVFSGDDHDFCDVSHRYNMPIPGTKSYFPNDDSVKAKYQQIREITVKSFSWAMGVRKPGFLLVSLWNPVDAHGNTIGTPLPTVQTHNCLLPDQLGIFIDYGLLFAITLIALLVEALVRSLRPGAAASYDDTPLTPTKLSLPRFKANGTANGFATSGHLSATKGRHTRGSSLSTSTHSANNSEGNLSVQRNYNARARSVSPAYGGMHQQTLQPGGPLIERAGFFPQVKWIDPTDEESDEESNVGTEGGDGIVDSQAKWKWRQRTPGKGKVVLTEYLWRLVIVGIPCGLWYLFLVRNG